MDERHNIVLRQASSDNPPDLLTQLKQSIEELCNLSLGAAGDYLSGKGQQEVAKALEIKTQALQRLGGLESERQRLLMEREKMLRDDRAKMYELETQRILAENERIKAATESLQKIVDSVARLKEMGVEVRLEVVMGALNSTLERIKSL